MMAFSGAGIKIPMMIASFTLFGSGSINVHAQNSEHAGVADAPPRRCEIRQKAWCIYQDGIEITNLQKLFPDDSYDNAWVLRDALYPYSQLVVFEPGGCRNGFADTIAPMGYEERVKWRGRLWDQMQVRLRLDGTCDLKLLVPLFDGQPVQWAFNSGPGMLAACMNDPCDGKSTTMTGVRDAYWNRYRRQVAKN